MKWKHSVGSELFIEFDLTCTHHWRAAQCPRHILGFRWYLWLVPTTLKYLRVRYNVTPPSC